MTCISTRPSISTAGIWISVGRPKPSTSPWGPGRSASYTKAWVAFVPKPGWRRSRNISRSGASDDDRRGFGSCEGGGAAMNDRAFPRGGYRVANPTRPLTADERRIVDEFHALYYRIWDFSRGAGTLDLHWMGFHTLKCPLDLWIYQEILVETEPDVIIETGTRYGGSAG